MKASEEGIVELKPKEGIRVKQIKIWGDSIPGKRNRMCKGSEKGKRLPQLSI